jgi:HlyD family secretion protein
MEIPSLEKESTATWLKGSLVVLFAIGGSLLLWQYLITSDRDTKSNLLIEAYPVTASNAVRVFGQLQPLLSSMVTTDVSGKIAEVNVSPGSVVSRGDVLVRLVNRSLNREIEEIELSILSKKVKDKSDVITSQQSLLEQKNNVTFAASDLNSLEIELNATEQLYQSGIVSHLNYVKLKASVERARVTLDAEKRKLQSLATTNQALSEVAQAELKILLSKKNYLEQQVKALDILAQESGVVTLMNDGLEVGSTLQEADFVAQIADPLDMYARLSVTASEAAKVQVGMSTVINIRGERVTARVSRVSPYVVENQIEFDAAFDATLPGGAIPNMNISGEVISNDEQALVGLPKISHVTDTRSRYTLYVLNKNTQTFELRHVLINAISENEMYVSEGLEVGETVLLISPDEYGSRASISYAEISS